MPGAAFDRTAALPVSTGDFAVVRSSAPVSGFTNDSVWFDGLAEVSVYEATRDRYGVPRRFEARLIVVSEEFDPVTLVKSDRPRAEGVLPVLKVHLMYDVPTEPYSYHFASSVFVDRRDPFVAWKLTATANEWCGITTHHLSLGTRPARLQWHSYFDGEGDADVALDWPAQAVTEEQLLVAVRGLAFSEGLEVPLQVLSRLTEDHARMPSLRAGTLRVGAAHEVADAAGTMHPAWPVTVDLPQGRLLYEVEVNSPHRVILHEAPGGLTMRLRESERWAYWR
jgi:hypothetical protein